MRPMKASPPRLSHTPRKKGARTRSLALRKTTLLRGGSCLKKAVMGISSAVDSLFSVVTEGEVMPRSIMLRALADSPLRRARARMETPRSSRKIRRRRPTSTLADSFPLFSILLSLMTGFALHYNKDKAAVIGDGTPILDDLYHFAHLK